MFDRNAMVLVGDRGVQGGDRSWIMRYGLRWVMRYG
jgi:hypothetical protein